jgi:hypothetical protein
MVNNFSDESLTIPKKTVLGVAEEVPEPLVNRLNAESKSEEISPAKPRRKRKNQALCQKLLHGKLEYLPQEQKVLNEPILLKYAHVFHDEDTNDFKSTDIIEHQIIMENVSPIRRSQYQTSYAQREEMKSQIEKMLDKGVIRESNSAWSVPDILVPKKTQMAIPNLDFV